MVHTEHNMIKSIEIHNKMVIRFNPTLSYVMRMCLYSFMLFCVHYAMILGSFRYYITEDRASYVIITYQINFFL